MKNKLDRYVREKAIESANIRILSSGIMPKDMKDEDLEVVVREEEDKIRSSFLKKGLKLSAISLAAMFGMNL